MASYEELYNKIHGENAYEESVKSMVGKVGLKGARWVKNTIVPNEEDLDMKLDTPAKKKAADVMGKAYNKAGDIGAKATSKIIESGLKIKYSTDMEKLESELKKNINKTQEYKEAIMAITVWVSTIPVSVGMLDTICKSIIQAGALANSDIALCEAARKANLWIPLTAKTVADIIAKLNKKEIDWSAAKEKFIKIYDKLENTLGAWARSDEPLFVPMKAKSRVDGKSKIDRAKEKGAVWKFDESVSAIFESYIDGNISGEEFDYLLESVVGDYDYQYEAYL